MSERDASPRTFPPSFKVRWGFASLGTNLISGSFGSLLQYFFQTYMGLGASWIGLAAWIYAIWNAINDPLFGFISDSTRSKRGRRVPYMTFTAPFLAFTFVLVWLVPPGWAGEGIFQVEKFWWMLLTMFLYDTTYTIIGLVYSALLPELTESDRERGELQKYSSVLGLVGLILGFVLPDLLRPKVESTSLLPLYVGVIAIAVAGAACIWITSSKVKERPEFVQVDKPLGFVPAIKYTFTSKSFLILTSANFMSIFMQAIVTGALYFLADYVLRVPTIVPLAMIFLGLLVGSFFANTLAVKRGVVQANQVLLLVSGAMMVSLPFLPDVLVYPVLFFAGFGLSGPLVLTNVLFAQVADEDELRSGVRREAVFFGVNALVTKPAQSVALALSAFLIEVAGFIPADPVTGAIEVNQPAGVLVAIRVSIGLLPGLAMLAGALILRWYPLKGSYLDKVHADIMVIHADKESRLDGATPANPGAG